MGRRVWGEDGGEVETSWDSVCDWIWGERSWDSVGDWVGGERWCKLEMEERELQGEGEDKEGACVWKN